MDYNLAYRMIRLMDRGDSFPLVRSSYFVYTVAEVIHASWELTNAETGLAIRNCTLIGN